MKIINKKYIIIIMMIIEMKQNNKNLKIIKLQWILNV